MAQRRAFKTDSSFFRMLAVGAVGAKAVQDFLNARRHEIVELERGSLGTKIWRDVKRKRVRIPDLCCTRCGVRIESRAKTRAELSMSHSPSDAERAWNYGMLDRDWVAFPILSARERDWTAGTLDSGRSLWRERTLTSWHLEGHVNIFSVSAFRKAKLKQTRAKGVTEGSEVQVKWSARFAPGAGRVKAVSGSRLDYTTDRDPARVRHFRLGDGEHSFLHSGATFDKNQVVAGQVAPLHSDQLDCQGGCDDELLRQMLRSPERTVRFTGCKLARMKKVSGVIDRIREIAAHPEEDPYVLMEAKSFLCEVAGESADEHYRPALLEDSDDQMRLEAAVTLAETRTKSAFSLLRQVLEDHRQPMFLRSACAWAIGSHGTQQAAECLVRAFGDVAPQIREEALIALEDLGSAGLDPLLRGLSGKSPAIAAGAAEALRRIRDVPAQSIAALAEKSESTWPAWTLAHLPKEAVVPHIAALQSSRPEVHFAISVLWAFLESWIAEDWTPKPTPEGWAQGQTP